MIRWNLAKRAKQEKGWKNAYQFAKGADISQPLAARILRNERLDRIDVETLEKLAKVFRVTPWELLEHKARE